ncbi:MAG: alpha-hydroxy-acid oxidizing protein [Firmicutes bacterium]|nr:alpha-hydroxy-acid oxidizing protein [Bacillota bacterium]
MTLAEIREAARERLSGSCRVCRVCDGRTCRGEVPGFGGVGTGASFVNNVAALASLKLNMRVLHEAGDPDTGFMFFGRRLAFPILGAPVAGVKVNRLGALTEFELADAMICGPALAGSIGTGGDGGDPQVLDSGLQVIKRLASSGGGMVILKPRVQEEIVKRMKRVEEAGAVAVGVDVDAAAFINMTLTGQKVEPKSPAMIAELVDSTSLPFVVKGVMTVDEAEVVAEAGAAAIVVSNHGGRVLDHTPGTADVLPAISRAVRGRTLVLADGGVRSGADVLKMLALGADAVLVGRPLAVAAVGGGVDGVKAQMEQLGSELRTAMIMTGCASLTDVGPGVLV